MSTINPTSRWPAADVSPIRGTVSYDSWSFMRTTCRSLLLLSLLVIPVACRSADGPVPEPSGDEADEVYELSRDILNVASGDPQAFQELTDDLGTQGPYETGQPRAAALAKSLQGALVGRQLTQEQAKRLADDLYIVFAGDKLSPGQVEAVLSRVSGLLREVGTPEDSINPVRDNITSVQALVNPGRKRWWDIL
jgi:hypothetical protein